MDCFGICFVNLFFDAPTILASVMLPWHWLSVCNLIFRACWDGENRFLINQINQVKESGGDVSTIHVPIVRFTRASQYTRVRQDNPTRRGMGKGKDEQT